MRLALREFADKALAIVLGLFLLLTLFRGGNTDTAVLFAAAGGLLLLISLPRWLSRRVLKPLPVLPPRWHTSARCCFCLLPV